MDQRGTSTITRRQFIRAGCAGLLATVTAACGSERNQQAAPPPAGVTPSAPIAGQDQQTRPTAAPTTPASPTAAPARHAQGRLQARPTAPSQPTNVPGPGVHPLGVTGERDTLLYIPAGYEAGRPAPLVVVLHGAGGNAEAGLSLLQQLADNAGLLLLAPASRAQTWDMIADDYGPDVALIDQALQETFSRLQVNPNQLAVGGFSDGASYALSLGIINGDLFKNVIAFSPGYMSPTEQNGTPRFYVSHGTNDTVLPIDRCSRRIVPELQRIGYDVLYREFDGPHTVPAEIAQEAVDWFGQQ